MSVGPTVTTTPLTGGIVRVWPTWSSDLEVRLLAHHTVIIETPNLRAMPVRVSPELDPVGAHEALAIGDGRVDRDGLEDRAVVQHASGSAVGGITVGRAAGHFLSVNGADVVAGIDWTQVAVIVDLGAALRHATTGREPGSGTVTGRATDGTGRNVGCE